MNASLKIAKEIYSWIYPRLSDKSELEVFFSQGRGRSVIWSEKSCEDISQSDGGGVGVRVILRDCAKGGRQGYAFTTSFERAAVEKTLERAIDSARALPADPHRLLPKLNTLQMQPQLMVDMVDESLYCQTISAIKEKLKAGEAQLLKKYPLLRSILRAGFSEGSSDIVILNSNGLEQFYSVTHAGLGVSCLAEQSGERQEGGYGVSKRFLRDLDWDFIFESSAQKTLALLGGKPIATGNIPVVFDPSVGCDFLSLAADAVCADSVQKGKSYLAGRLGTSVASEHVTLVDDGLLPQGLASSPVDDEGVPTQTTLVLERGLLKQWLYDTYAALKDNTVSTGNAVRSGYGSSPSAGTSNFYMRPGSMDREKLMAQTTGLYLLDVMGLHMADPISGDFSLAAIGYWLERGERKFGVRGVTLAGNLLDLFKKVDCVCSDLTFFGSVGSPTFRVQDLSVSGS